MGRTFKGQIHVRISPDTHEEVAKEAFQKGSSISGILAQALVVRNVLRDIDPWKSIAEVREANQGLTDEEIDAAIDEAIKAVRKEKRHRV
jgi:Asp-tRNA(Asn)/Glu-tRNA(Gln) amidotransferase B subunit